MGLVILDWVGEIVIDEKGLLCYSFTGLTHLPHGVIVGEYRSAVLHYVILKLVFGKIG